MVIEWNPSRGATLGVEWELQLIDARTQGAAPGGLRRARGAARARRGQRASQIRYELMQSTLELATGICSTVAEAKEDLGATIAQLQRVTTPAI